MTPNGLPHSQRLTSTQPNYAKVKKASQNSSRESIELARRRYSTPPIEAQTVRSALVHMHCSIAITIDAIHGDCPTCQPTFCSVPIVHAHIIRPFVFHLTLAERRQLPVKYDTPKNRCDSQIRSKLLLNCSNCLLSIAKKGDM